MSNRKNSGKRMSIERGAVRAQAARYWVVSRKLLHRFVDVFKISSLFVAAILMLIAALPKSPTDLEIADADDLLLKLTALGREGAVVLCDPGSIEKYLSVHIDQERLSKNGGNNSPVAVNARSQPVFGNYWKFRAGTSTVCRLQLQVSGRRFCDTDSARTQRLIGSRVQTRLPVPGEADFYDHGYELARDSRERSTIGWRHPSQSCPAEVEIAVATR